MPRKTPWQILAPLFRKVSSLLIMKKLDPNPFLDSIHGAIPSILSLGIIFKQRFNMDMVLYISDSLSYIQWGMWPSPPTLLVLPPWPFKAVPFSLKEPSNSHESTHTPMHTMALSQGLNLPSSPSLLPSFTCIILVCSVALCSLPRSQMKEYHL